MFSKFFYHCNYYCVVCESNSSKNKYLTCKSVILTAAFGFLLILHFLRPPFLWNLLIPLTITHRLAIITFVPPYDFYTSVWLLRAHFIKIIFPSFVFNFRLYAAHIIILLRWIFIPFEDDKLPFTMYACSALYTLPGQQYAPV